MISRESIRSRAGRIAKSATPLLFVAALGWLVAPPPATAQDVISQEEPPPSSVDEIVTPIDRFLRLRPVRPGVFPWVKKQLEDTPPFLRDTTLDMNLRSFYLARDAYGDAENEAWALGGALLYRSGWLADRLSIGATLYTSHPAHAPDSKDGTTLLQPSQEHYWVLGESFARVKLDEKNVLNLYRYGEYNTPFIGRNDNRMTPNTFEGYTLTGSWGGEDGGPGLAYGAGYIAKIKERNADNFVWMSTDAGVDRKRGVIVGGARFTYGDFSLGAVEYYSEDVINIAYTEGRYVMRPTEAVGVALSAQYADQRSVDDELLGEDGFSTRQAGVKLDASWGGAILTLGYTVAHDDDDLRAPWSGYPGYTSVQVQDFNRAGEQAFLVKGSYDLSRAGLEGVAMYVLFVHGWSREDPSTGEAVADEDELDVDLQWRPHLAMLEGFSFRTRYAYVQQWQGDEDTIHDFRLIVNYDFSFM